MEERKVGWITMACLLMSDQVGYGILAAPSIYRRLGYVGATAAILLLSMMTTYTGLLLVRIRKKRPEINSYRALFAHFFNPAFGNYASAFCNLFLFFVICGSVLVQAEAWANLSPSMCYIRWIVVAAFASLLLFQVRTLPNIGVLSIVNCVLIVVPNIIMLYSFTAYVGTGAKKKGLVLPFPEDVVESWVAVLDLLFSFAGHVVFFELMQEMADPEDFSKAIWLSQTLTTVLYMFNGLYVYATVGDAPWMMSPANLSIDDGVAKDICLWFIISYFAISVLVDGTVFVRNVEATFQPLLSTVCHCLPDRNQAEKKTKKLEGSDIESSLLEGKEGKDTGLHGPEASKTQSSATTWISVFQKSMSWMLWSTVTMALVCIVTAAIGNYNDMLGIIAALVASQTTITWPCFFYFWMHERISERHEECYYHGSGTSPCKCSKRRIFRSPRLWIATLGVVIAIGGFWANSVDLAGQRPKDPRIGWFDCRSSPFATNRNVNRDKGTDLQPIPN